MDANTQRQLRSSAGEDVQEEQEEKEDEYEHEQDQEQEQGRAPSLRADRA